MPAVASRIGFLLAWLGGGAVALAAAEDDPGYAWMGGVGDG
jgi:hypothetical protein